MRLTMLIGLALLCLSACATDTTGAACSSDRDCGGGQSCATNYPGGYCYSDCSSSCTAGGLCARLAGSSDSYCFERCRSSSECRSGYSCKDISNSTDGICLPR